MSEDPAALTPRVGVWAMGGGGNGDTRENWDKGYELTSGPQEDCFINDENDSKNQPQIRKWK